MRLQRLSLRNFKGVRKLDLEPNGQNTFIFGDNGTGKTSVNDAAHWVLTNRDSLGQADFDIKTLDENGQAIPKLEHEVEMVLDLGDEELTLKKVYKEVRTKKRGSAREEFTGHTTDHYIDGVPLNKKDYDQRVSEIAPADVFRLLTDPTAFNALHWQKRRELLLEVCGDVSDADVIASNEELADLPGILGKHGVDDHKKVVEARRREINQELQRLPVRIDEVTQGMPELPDADKGKLEADLAQLREERQALEQERARIQAGGQVAEHRKRLTEIQGELTEVEFKARGAIDQKVREAKQEASGLRDRSDAKARDVRRLQGELEDAGERIESLASERAKLREDWRTVKAREFEHAHDDDNCPVCGQALPEEQVKDAHQRALEEFNQRKAGELEQVQKAGQAAKEKAERLESQVEDLKLAVAEGTTEVEALTAQVEKADAAVERLEKAIPDTSKNPKYQQLLAEKQRVEEAIEQLRAGNSEALEEVNGRVAAVDERAGELQAALARFEQVTKDEARIEELKAQEEILSGEHEELTRELFLCETFIRSKVDMLTERINSKFELARFKLFDVQVNGGVNETCETTYKGVPFGSLNHGARIQVGLDIVRTLQAHYGLFPPVWVDNRESVTSLPDMSCQVISLVVSESDKKLRVELGALERQEVAA